MMMIKHMKVKSYLYFTSFTVCIFPIISLIFCYIYTNTPYLTGILTELNNSLNDFPLSDLQYVQNCSEEKYLQLLYKVPASFKGCACLNISYYKWRQANKSLVSRGKCNKNKTLNGCISIDYYPPVDFFKWHSNQFCSKRYNNTLGYKLFFKDSVGKDENCKKGFKKCGKLDNMENYICLPENESCPINDIFVSNIKNDSLNDTYEIYEFGDKYLYYSNKIYDNPLITKLKTAEGKLCAGKGYYHTDYPQFILDENFYLYGCRFKIYNSLYDESIEKLDYMTKEELFNDNNFSMHSRYNYSCEYPYYSLNAQLFLYPKKYIGFDKKCLKENNLDIDNKLFDNDTINNINSNLLLNRKLHNILIWFSIAAIDFYFMTCFFINIDEENNLKNFYIWCIITVPFYISMVIISIIGLIAMSNIKTYPLCNDDYTNSKLDLFNTKKREFFYNTLAIFIAVNGQLLLTIFLYIFKRRKVLRSKNEVIESKTQSQSQSQMYSFNTYTQHETPLISQYGQNE